MGQKLNKLGDKRYSPKIYDKNWKKAIKKNDIRKVKKLIKVNGFTKEQWALFPYPLAHAITLGHVELVKLLIESGIDVNNCWQFGISNLTLCARDCCQNSSEIFKLLLEAGANFNIRHTFVIFIVEYLLRKDDINLLQYLIEIGLNINCVKGNYSYLDRAVQHEATESAKLLIKKGADIECLSWSLRTTLLMRICYDNLYYIPSRDSTFYPVDFNEVMFDQTHCPSWVKFFLEEGADANAKDLNGFTVLHYACVSYNAEVVKLLLEAGADITTANIDLSLHTDVKKLHINIFLILYILLQDIEKERISYILSTSGIISEICLHSQSMIKKLQSYYLGKSTISLRDYLNEQDVNKLAHYLDNDTSLLQQQNIKSLAENYGPYKDMIIEKLEKGRKRRSSMLKTLTIMNHCNLKVLPALVQTKLAGLLVDEILLKFTTEENC